MNKNIINALIAGSITMSLASCSENSWNDHFLDGFEGGVDYDQTEEGTYTLSSADYSTIASLMGDEAVSDAEKAEAKAIGTNLYFDKNGTYPASVALPAFLNTASFPYYLASNGSTFDITYQEAGAVPAELTAIAGAKTYTVSSEDYAKVWGSETAYIKSFAPDADASSNLPSILPVTFDDAAVEDGTYIVVTYNTASQNPMFGFPDEAPAVADLYADATFKAGKYVLYTDGIVANIMDPTLADGKYSYFEKTDVTATDGSISGYDIENNVFVFTDAETAGQYYLGDDLGHYYYGSSRYNNFYISSSKVNSDDYKWTVTKNDDGTWTIMNVLAQKWIQYSANYTTWGEYNYDSGPCPQLYIPNTEASTPVEIPTYTPASTTENAVYCYSSGKWTVAEGVVALNPADYTAMGFSNNQLSDPEIYIPLYLKGNLPYAQSGDQVYVVYNKTKTDLFVYDGLAWTLNNNGLETVTGRFEKKDNKWSFVKYIGKAIFQEYQEEAITLDRSYLLVSGDVCGTVIDKNNSYGYIQVSSVTISNGQIIAQTDANAYLFASSYDNNGSVVNAPEGSFLIRDTYGRYLYMTGTYSSANLSTTPTITDGNIADNYLWSATRNADGTWTISNKGNERTWFYSSKYNNFAAYATQSEVDSYPTLYILSE